jgi:8-oxo-dGTP diphosphatase
LVTDSSTGPLALVVGVALVDSGRLLIARRTAPAHLTGMWELPGGKVESGESVAAAAVREIAEELAVGIEVVDELPGRYLLNASFEMVVVLARLATPAEPTPSGSHDNVGWLSEAELAHNLTDLNYPWVPADVAALTAVVAAGWMRSV